MDYVIWPNFLIIIISSGQITCSMTSRNPGHSANIYTCTVLQIDVWLVSIVNNNNIHPSTSHPSIITYSIPPYPIPPQYYYPNPINMVIIDSPGYSISVRQGPWYPLHDHPYPFLYRFPTCLLRIVSSSNSEDRNNQHARGSSRWNGVGYHMMWLPKQAWDCISGPWCMMYHYPFWCSNTVSMILPHFNQIELDNQYLVDWSRSATASPTQTTNQPTIFSYDHNSHTIHSPPQPSITTHYYNNHYSNPLNRSNMAIIHGPECSGLPYGD